MKSSGENWSRSAANNFWDVIARSDHVVQIYDDDQSFLTLLEGFVMAGIAANECVVVIATEEHLHALEDRLKFRGHNVFELKLQDQYIPLSARETLGEFMINTWPDEVLFMHLVHRLIARAKSMNRNIRAFGEMVALLWSQGSTAATVQLEHLWDKICQKQSLCLFCAYPRNGFNQRSLESILQICGSHSKVIKFQGDFSQEILFKDIGFKDNRSEKAG